MGGRFCLQRHQASRLHYDLRLELGSALLSWAVPKGPTLQALGKRLAVRTEDHPLKYLEWEGNIPKGNYGAGTMMVFDVGYWEPVLETEPNLALKQGELKFRLWGQKVAGEWTLVSTKESWLLIKKKDAWCREDWDPEDYLWSAVSGRTFEEIKEGRAAPAPRKKGWPKGAKKAAIPSDIKPMLAQIAEPFDAPDWSYEVKWDGVRALASCHVQSLQVNTRNGNSLLANFPELKHLRARMAAESFVLDGELVILDEEGISHFDRIATRLRVDDISMVYNLARSKRAVLYVFDLLYLDGRDIRSLPWTSRRKLLEETLRPDSWVRFSESLPGRGTEIFKLVESKGLEGLMAKKQSSPYVSGRSDSWLKLKTKNLADCVIVGFTEPRGGRSGVGSLILAQYQDGKLRLRGRVGTGFKQEDLLLWKSRLDPLKVAEPVLEEDPKAQTRVTWCEPQYVVEVEFSRYTKDGRLFHPVFVRDRPDLEPENCGDGLGRHTAFKETEQKTVKISNAQKLLFPSVGASKLDLAEYYQQVAEMLLPHIKDRPLSLRRYPNGVDKPDFFQRHAAPGFPSWLRGAGEDGFDSIYCDSAAGLLYLSNLASIELHVTLARRPDLESPDGIFLDLDPQGCSFEMVKQVAREAGKILKELAWRGYVKTTGSRGLHIFIPLRSGYNYEQSKLVAGILAEILRKRLPDRVTLVRNTAKRPKDHVYIDVPQNRANTAMASVYSVRATPTASVSVPLAWSELEGELGPRDFTISNSADWIKGRETYWSLNPDPKHSLEELLPKLEKLMSE